MKDVLCRHTTSFFTFALAALVSGCAAFLPVPSHREVIAIEASRSNNELTDAILEILADEHLVHCNIGWNLSEKNPTPCPIPWWSGDLTLLDKDKAEITLGHYPIYQNNVAGHSAKISRKTPETLIVIVKGQGPYFFDLPNREVAVLVAELLREQL